VGIPSDRYSGIRTSAEANALARSTDHWQATFARRPEIRSGAPAQEVEALEPIGSLPIALAEAEVMERSSNTAKPSRASSESVRKRMQSTPQRDTPAELSLRRNLHAMGLRYRVDTKPLANSPRRADIVFRRARVAVFVDGCFWHGCPEHGSWPSANADFWREKIQANQKRDLDTNRQLEERGWLVLRVWEHEDPKGAAQHVARRVRARVDDAAQMSKSPRS
jgi:DNA mismatch endonuclease, patch repair protein